MSNYPEKSLSLKPGLRNPANKHFDPGFITGNISRTSRLCRRLRKNLQEKWRDLQYRMYAENKHSLLIVLQGLDAGWARTA